MKIIVDGFGGDNAPIAVLEGCAAAVKEYGVQLIVTGDEEKLRKAAAEREERLVGVAQLEARKQLLEVKQEMLEKAFEQALQDLLNLPEKDYVELLSKLIAQAAQSGREEVIFSQKDRPRYGKAAVTQANERLGEKGHLTLSAQTRPIQGGFILSDGEVEVNGTFDTLVRLQRRELDGPVGKVLFQDQA